MKMGRKIICIITLIFFSLSFSSCWNYRELNKVDLVLGFSVDKSKENGMYAINVEILNPKTETDVLSGKTKTSKGEGNTIFEAIRSMVNIGGNPKYWSHCQVAIFSKSIAEEGLIPAIDLLDRDIEIRSSIDLLICDDEVASTILENTVGKDRIVSMDLKNIIESQKSSSSFVKTDLIKFVEHLYNEGKDPVIPIVKYDYKSNNPKVEGLAVFKGDKMVGSIFGRETLFYNIIVNNTKNYLYILNKDKTGFDSNVTLEIFNGKTKIEPVYKNGKIEINIYVDIEASIGEIMGNTDVISEKKDELIHITEEDIKINMLNLINKVGNDYKADIFGFGKKIRENMPNNWKNIKNDWENEFGKYKYNIFVNLNITKSQLTQTPIGKEIK